MNPLADPSLRRYLLALGGFIAAVGNKKLGLDLTPEQVTELLIFLGGVIAVSNGKEVMLKRAEVAGATAAAAVTPESAAGIIKEAAK